MKMRAALATSAVLAGLLAGASHAATAPAKSCKLLTDPTGDAYAGAGVLTAEPNDSSLDLISGDIATSTKQLTAVIRVAKLAATDPMAPLGRVYYMLFNVKGFPERLWVSAGIFPNATQFRYGWEDTSGAVGSFVQLGDATGKIDTAKGEIRIHSPLKFADKTTIKKGAKISGLTADARRFLGQRIVTPPKVSIPVLGGIPSGFVSSIDDATSTKGYIAGAPSCVVVGK
jgi:hypothetical protein